jgi:hypothetical protein
MKISTLTVYLRRERTLESKKWTAYRHWSLDSLQLQARTPSPPPQTVGPVRKILALQRRENRTSTNFSSGQCLRGSNKQSWRYGSNRRSGTCVVDAGATGGPVRLFLSRISSLPTLSTQKWSVEFWQRTRVDVTIAPCQGCFFSVFWLI